jgi:hypothetical protein
MPGRRYISSSEFPNPRILSVKDLADDDDDGEDLTFQDYAEKPETKVVSHIGSYSHCIHFS